MPNKQLIQEIDGTPKQICLADHAGDFSPTAANDLRDATAGNRVDADLEVASVVNGAYRQAVKFDLGEHRADEYAGRAALEFAASGLTAGQLVVVYVGYSQSATAGTANPGGASGADAAYTGYSSNADDSIAQFPDVLIGVVTGQATGTVQNINLLGRLRPTGRYGVAVFKNDSGASMHSDDVESHIVLDPVIPEVQ